MPTYAPSSGESTRFVAVEVPLAHELRDAAALDELHREEVRALLDPELVDGDDVRVAQGDGRLRLLDEATHELLVERELVPDLLDDELLLEAARAAQRREHDARHAAARELAFEHVLAEDLRIHAGSKRIRSSRRTGPFAPDLPVHCATGWWSGGPVSRSGSSWPPSPLGTSCKPEARFEDRPLVVYSPRRAPSSQSEAYSVIYGNGDFEDSQSAVSSLYLRDVGEEMSELPAETRSVIVDVSHPAQSVDWRGTAEIPTAGPINVLVWPGGETCRLTRNVEPRTEVSLGVFGRHLMVAGGRRRRAGPAHVRRRSHDRHRRATSRSGSRRARSRATITAFRETPDQDPAPALVAGGEDPDSQTPAHAPPRSTCRSPARRVTSATSIA